MGGRNGRSPFWVPPALDLDTSTLPADSAAVATADECVVCLEMRRCVVLVPCGHLVLCSGCTRHIVEAGTDPSCPVCRESMTGLVGVY